MTIRTVVVGTDFSELGDAGVESARDFASRHRAKRLHVVHVVGTSQATSLFPYPVTAGQMLELHEHAVQDAKKRLQALSERLNFEGVTQEVRVGIPARELARASDDVGGDFLFISTHGYGGFKRLMMGSVANAIVRVAHCPVLVVGPGREYRAPRNVLAAVDLSPVSSEVIRRAVAMARMDQGHVRIVSLFEHPLVYVPDNELLPRYYSALDGKQLEKKQEEAVRGLLADVDTEGVEITIDALSKSPPALVILEVATLMQSDLIVIGTSGHNAWHRMILGSTAGRVVLEATCPVLAIPRDIGAPSGT